MGRMRYGISLLLVVLCSCMLLISACSDSSSDIMTSPLFIPATESRVLVEGRAVPLDDQSLLFGYPGVSLHMQFAGQRLRVVAHSSSGENHLSLHIDDQPAQRLRLSKTAEPLVLIDSDTPVRHRIRLVHHNETWQGQVTVRGFLLESGQLLAPDDLPARKLLFIGDSITCGDAIERGAVCRKDARWWNADKIFGRLTAEALNAQAHLVCYGGRGLIRSWNGNRDELNAPDFFELALANPANPVPWDHQTYTPDLILVALGTNDFNLGIEGFPAREEYVTAYVNFVETLLGYYPHSHVALTEGPMVNDEADPDRPQKTVLREYIHETLERLNRSGQVSWIPSTHYPGDDCDAHPTAEQHATMAEELIPVIRQRLNW